jgi:hypothetical protein
MKISIESLMEKMDTRTESVGVICMSVGDCENEIMEEMLTDVEEEKRKRETTQSLDPAPWREPGQLNKGGVITYLKRTF